MVVGLLTLEIHLPYARSLKDKRQVLRRLKERLRGRFNVAVAELDHQDTWQRAQIGVVALNNDGLYVTQQLEAACGEAEGLLGDSLADSHIEYLS
jgi:uncharacterized protein YlxP (DUF503 family)